MIACPARLVITRETAWEAFRAFGVDEDALKGLNERQLVAGYVALHVSVGLEKIREDAT